MSISGTESMSRSQKSMSDTILEFIDSRHLLISNVSEIPILRVFQVIFINRKTPYWIKNGARHRFTACTHLHRFFKTYIAWVINNFQKPDIAILDFKMASNFCFRHAYRYSREEPRINPASSKNTFRTTDNF